MTVARLAWIAAAFALLIPPLTPAAAGDGDGDFWSKTKQLLGPLSGSSGTGSGTGSGSATSALSAAQVAKGLREALTVGTGRVVTRLGALDGFNTDPAVHIPLPDTLRTVQSALAKFGMSNLADDLELRMNRAAETAMPVVRDLFVEAISQMTLDDAMGIYNGPKDAATRYFQGKTSASLVRRMGPVIDTALAEAGAVQAYDAMLGQYKALPFMPDVKADLTRHVARLAGDGVFHYLAQEEAAIRDNPQKRTTELLRSVFGK